MLSVDAVELTRALVRCASVTPDSKEALDLVEAQLSGLGLTCHRLPFGKVDNLFAKWGTASPSLAFCGHVDVVPPGDISQWSIDPFAGALRDGMVWGRGAADMKSGLACFIAAVATHIGRHVPGRGSISFIVTGDEEGPSVDGTVRVLDWAAAQGERFDGCIVGEPTSRQIVGDTVKIGRRGSANGRLTAHGRSGHTAYPSLADNAAHRLVRMLHRLIEQPLDAGSQHFEPSTLQVSSIDIGNPTTNVIPAGASARFNIRYNDQHTAASLEQLIRGRCDEVGGSYELILESSGDAFLTAAGPLTRCVVQSVEAVTGCQARLDTSGGTSDARFVRHYCPVVEFGLVGATMHQADERVAVADIRSLTTVYEAILDRWFAED